MQYNLSHAPPVGFLWMLTFHQEAVSIGHKPSHTADLDMAKSRQLFVASQTGGPASLPTDYGTRTEMSGGSCNCCGWSRKKHLTVALVHAQVVARIYPLNNPCEASDRHPFVAEFPT